MTPVKPYLHQRKQVMNFAVELGEFEGAVLDVQNIQRFYDECKNGCK